MSALLDGLLSRSLKCHLSWQQVSQGAVLRAQEKGVCEHASLRIRLPGSWGRTSRFSLCRP